MQLLRSIPRRRTTSAPAPIPAATPRDSALEHIPEQAPGRATGPAPAEEDAPYDTRVLTVHRIGAIGVALVILVFGVLGFANGLAFFSTNGDRILGMSSNGLLSTISVLTAVVLIAAALRGPRVASTVMIVVGALFILSALANLAVLRTSFNVLAFELTNVGFSVVAGLVLLLLGAYGRVSGNLPPDSPYARAGAGEEPGPDGRPRTPEEFAAERAMRAAEIAVVNHVATADQRRRVAAMARVRSRQDRRRVWMQFDTFAS
jgi:hypothetical protein